MRALLVSLLLVLVVPVVALSQQADEETSTWKGEFLLGAGNRTLYDIEDHDQPAVLPSSSSGMFGFRFRRQIGWKDFELSLGLSFLSRQGQGYLDGTPFSVTDASLDFPLMLHTTSENQVTDNIAVLFGANIGAYLSVLLEQEVHQLPGHTLAPSVLEGEGAFGYMRLGFMAELRLGLRVRDYSLTLGIYAGQDELTFGAGDDVAVRPLFRNTGISIGLSRSIF